MRRRRLPVLFLGVIVAGLGYANWRVLQLDLDISPANAGTVPAETLAIPGLEPPPEPLPVSEFAEIVRRPLFTASRRPPQAPEEEVVATAAVAPVEQAPPPPDFRLLGVALDEGSRQALLRSPEQPGQWVKLGESFGGWVLESVSAEGVVLVSGERIQEVRLYPGRGSAEAAH